MREDITRDLDYSIKGISLEDASKQLVRILEEFNNGIYSFIDINIQNLSIATSNYEGIRINFKIKVLGTSIISKGNIDIAIEDIKDSAGIQIIGGNSFYSIERTLADKYVSAIYWGKANTRVKDFLDINNLYNMINDKELFIKLIKELLITKSINNEKISAWLNSYKEWTDKHKIYGLNKVLSEINKLIF